MMVLRSYDAKLIGVSSKTKFATRVSTVPYLCYEEICVSTAPVSVTIERDVRVAETSIL